MCRFTTVAKRLHLRAPSTAPLKRTNLKRSGVLVTRKAYHFQAKKIYFILALQNRPRGAETLYAHTRRTSYTSSATHET
jgi:hypothetical protein